MLLRDEAQVLVCSDLRRFLSLAEMKEAGFIDDFAWLANYTLAAKRCALSADDRYALLRRSCSSLVALCLVSVVHAALEYYEYVRVFDASYAVSLVLYLLLLASIWLFDERSADRSLRVRLSRPEPLEPLRLAACMGLLVGCLGLQVGMWLVYDAVVGVAWPDAELWRESLTRGLVGGSSVLLLQSVFELYVRGSDEWSEYLKTLHGMASMMVYNVMYILLKRKAYSDPEDCPTCLRRETRYFLYGYMCVVFAARSIFRALLLCTQRLRQLCSLKRGRLACSAIRGSRLPIVEYVQLDFGREARDPVSELRWAILNTCYALCSSHVTSSVIFGCLASALVDLLCYDADTRLLRRLDFEGCYMHIRKFVHLYLTCLVLSLGCVFMYDDVQDSVYYYLYLLLVFLCVLLMRRYLPEDRPATDPSADAALQTSERTPTRQAARAASSEADLEESEGLLEEEKDKGRRVQQRPDSEENGTAQAETPGREAKVKEITDRFLEDMLEERKRYDRLLAKYNQRIEIGALKDRDGRVLFELIEGLLVARRLKKVAQLVPRVICEASDEKLSDYYYPQFDVYLAHDEWLDYAVKHEIEGLDKLLLPHEEPSLEPGLDFADFMLAQGDLEYRKVFEVYMRKHKLRDMLEDHQRRRGADWLREKRSELTVWTKLERSDMSVANADKLFESLSLLYDKFTTYEIGAQEVAQLVESLAKLHRVEQLLMVNRMFYVRWRKPRGIDRQDFCQTVRAISSDNVERQLLVLLGLADLEDSGSVALEALRGVFELSGVKDCLQRKSAAGVLGEVFGGEEALPAKELLARSLASEDMKAMCSTLFK